MPGKSRCVHIHHYHPNERRNINYSAIQMKNKDKYCKLILIIKVKASCAWTPIILALGNGRNDIDNNLEAIYLHNL